MIGCRDALEIGHELVRRADVAPAAERVRAALGNDVRPAAGGADPLCLLGEKAIALAPCGPRDPPDLRADEPVEEDVAGGRRGLRRVLGPEDEDALHAELTRRQRRRARVIRLLAAAGDDV